MSEDNDKNLNDQPTQTFATYKDAMKHLEREIQKADESFYATSERVAEKVRWLKSQGVFVPPMPGGTKLPEEVAEKWGVSEDGGNNPGLMMAAEQVEQNADDEQLKTTDDLSEHLNEQLEQNTREAKEEYEECAKWEAKLTSIGVHVAPLPAGKKYPQELVEKYGVRAEGGNDFPETDTSGFAELEQATEEAVAEVRKQNEKWTAKVMEAHEKLTAGETVEKSSLEWAFPPPKDGHGAGGDESLS